MTKIYLLRHCEAYGNIYRRLDGIRDTDVTEKGQMQIDYVSERFRSIPLDAVFSSHLIRARKTAAGIAKAANAPHHCCEALHERSMGIFDSKTWHEAAFVYPEIFREWTENFNSFTIPEGESLNNAGSRFRNEILTICRAYKDKTIAVVAHSMVMKAFLESITQGPVPFGNNTAVSLLEVDPDMETVSVVFMNDDSHLPESMRQSRQRWTKRGSKLEDYSLRYIYRSKDGSGSPVMEESDDVITLEGHENDKKIGFLKFVINDQNAEIKELFVYPEFRRNGFATQLIGEAMYSASKKECRNLIYTYKDRDIIIDSLAKRNGFLMRDHFFIRDIAMENYFIQK